MLVVGDPLDGPNGIVPSGRYYRLCRVYIGLERAQKKEYLVGRCHPVTGRLPRVQFHRNPVVHHLWWASGQFPPVLLGVEFVRLTSLESLLIELVGSSG